MIAARPIRNVDFLIVRDRKPWFLVEVKTSDSRPGPALAYFHDKFGTRHAFHAVLEAPHVDRDCFSRTDPVAVPLRTLLSQLV